MKKLIPIFLILIAIPLVFVVVFMKMTMKPVVRDGSTWAYHIDQEYNTAVNVLLDQMEKDLNLIEGDFSLDDKTILTDATRLQAGRKVVEGTTRLDEQLFDNMKGEIDKLKTKYAGTSTLSPALQTAYDSLVKDFQDLKELDRGRADPMLAFLDFVIANQGEISLQGDKVILNQKDLIKKYDSLEKAALEKQNSFDVDQNRLMDLHDQHLAAFIRELGKLQAAT